MGWSSARLVVLFGSAAVACRGVRPIPVKVMSQMPHLVLTTVESLGRTQEEREINIRVRCDGASSKL